MLRIALLAVLTSLALPAAAAPASELVPPLPIPPASVLDQESEEEDEEAVEGEEDEFEACEEEEEECEEGDGSVGGSRAGRSDASSQCVLRSASARATTTANDKLKLTIGYTTSEPVSATIEVRKGSIHIGTFKRHLGRSGVLRFTKPLGRKGASGRTVIRIKLQPGGAGCSTRLVAKS